MCPFLNRLVCKEVLEVELLLRIDTKLTAGAGSLFLWSLSVHFLIICQALMIKSKGHTMIITHHVVGRAVLWLVSQLWAGGVLQQGCGTFSLEWMKALPR